MSYAKRTQWFDMAEKPSRPGQYEGLEKGTGNGLVVYWRQLEDTDAPQWYFDKGNWGPFRLWESASKHMTAWRGLEKKP